MVVKDTKASPWEWRDPIHWRSNLPRELQVHKVIDRDRPAGHVSGYDNLLKHDGYRLMMRQRRYRLYLEYCEGGTLQDVVLPHFGRRANPQPAYPWTLTRGNPYDPVLMQNGRLPQLIPEYFIWILFRSLVNACQVLHFGHVADVPGSIEDWKPITHLDIKLDNIFLQPLDEDDAGESEVSRLLTRETTVQLTIERS